MPHKYAIDFGPNKPEFAQILQHHLQLHAQKHLKQRAPKDEPYRLAAEEYAEKLFEYNKANYIENKSIKVKTEGVYLTVSLQTGPGKWSLLLKERQDSTFNYIITTVNK